MPVGNDVVDLRDPANRPSAIHPRFDARVFSDAERRLLDASGTTDSRHRLRWTLWAAKEAALKCARQVDPGSPFRPAQTTLALEGIPESRATTRLRGPGGELAVRLDGTKERVHAVVTGVEDPDPVVEVRPLAVSAPARTSAEVRRLAAAIAAGLFDMEPGDVEVVVPGRNAPGGPVPRVLARGARLPVDLSLSHDGAWIATALLLHRDPPVPSPRNRARRNQSSSSSRRRSSSSSRFSAR